MRKLIGTLVIGFATVAIAFGAGTLDGASAPKAAKAAACACACNGDKSACTCGADCAGSCANCAGCGSCCASGPSCCSK